jgi:pyruvate dehydrogenase E2 component (dihydrolipoamide acetyltransferase)
MPTEVKLPELGENLKGGEILDVRVSPGDMVSEGQTLLEVEAEKSTLEVPSPLAGRVTELRVHKGDTIEVGQTVCLIDSNGAKDGEAKPAGVREEQKTEPEPREAPSRGQPPDRPKDRRAKDIEKQVEPAAARESRPPEPERPEEAPTGNGRRREPAPSHAPAKTIPAGPATRRLARELGVDLTQVTGTAPRGRVTPDDVKEFVRQVTSAAAPQSAAKAAALPDFQRWGEVERRPLDAIRRKTAEQMSLAWSQVPHVTQHDQADITDLEAFRKKQEGGPKLTVTAFALKAAAIALRQFPDFNSSLDTAANQLIVKHYYHIGVAVDTEHGLLVPVIRDVDRKSVTELAAELIELAEKARQKKLSLEEMRGGTFTITNLGGIGGTGFTPIVNYPEVAILGLSRGRLQPVVRDGQVTPRLLLPLSLSYDHRVIDGAAAARFVRRLAEMLENPMIMLLHA